MIVCCNTLKGFRQVTQTVDPKTGKLNKPKQGKYYDFSMREFTDGQVKRTCLKVNGGERLNDVARFCAQPEVFNVLTEQERKYLYELCILGSKAHMKARVIYCGSEAKDLIPLFNPFVSAALEGYRNPNENYFGEMVLPVEEIEKTQKPDFKPFKVVSHGFPSQY
ncbi:MAG: hypothetical protein EBR82_80395 [Caulobacteraceae bacterium]|nr:hypothetical protein [Caulobacteraceae bacterium]